MEQENQSESATAQDAGSGPGEQFPLARRGQRLAARILDGISEILIAVPVALAMGLPQQVQALAEGGILAQGVLLQLVVVGFVIHLLLHGYLLYFYGQTIGKRIMGIAIVTPDNRVPGFNRIIGLRYLPFYLAAQIPVISLIALIDILFIFRRDRRCLHDMLAKTRVIDVSSRQAGFRV